MIELIQVKKSFRDQIALDNINLFIQEGEIFGIIGKSGAGKSTLLRTLNLLEKPDQGQVLIDKEDLVQLNDKHLRLARKKMAMVFQHFNLLNSKTVYDNIALPMRIQKMNEVHIKEKIETLLQLVELEDKIYAYPNELSGGQKQRVSIARALSTEPKILLCDEATSALDPSATQAILNLLKKINVIYGITLVLITHEMEIVKQICHRVSVMEAGHILETTSLETAFSDKESTARKMLYQYLTPKLPNYLETRLGTIPNDTPLIRLFFEGEGAKAPFISQVSRDLDLNINILLANIDQFNDMTCGVLIAELCASKAILSSFIKRCQEAGLTVEILGYVTHSIN